MRMTDIVIVWLMGHPILGVFGLALFGVAVSYALSPRLQEVVRHGHPRC